MKKRSKKKRGIALTELVVAMAISVIPISVVGVLLVGGQRNWAQTYAATNNWVQEDAKSATTVFENIGRKSDPETTRILSSADGNAKPGFTPSGKKIVTGDSVDFRFWGKAKPIIRRGRNKAETLQKPDQFARFYLNGNQLKVDYGTLGPKDQRNKINNTIKLADNVIGLEFSRIYQNNVLQDNIRMTLTVQDDLNNPKSKTFTVKSSTLMRN